MNSKSVSIRLPEKLIEDLKELGQSRGLGYQTLMKSVLTKWVSDQTNSKDKDPELEFLQSQVYLSAGTWKRYLEHTLRLRKIRIGR